jgi:hypothetical protein
MKENRMATEPSSDDSREHRRFVCLAIEVLAGFSVACLLTLMLMPAPLNIREKIATCLFAIGLPLQISARVVMEGESDSRAWKRTADLRIWANLLVVSGFGFFLSAIYWPASVLYVIAAIVSPFIWIRAKEKALTQDVATSAKTGEVATTPQSKA